MTNARKELKNPKKEQEIRNKFDKAANHAFKKYDKSLKALSKN